MFISVIFPIIGNLRPDLVSFLPSMRQYAGNWASATWAFRDREKEDRMNDRIVKASKNQIDQLIKAGFPEPLAEMFLDKAHRLAQHAQPGPGPDLADHAAHAMSRPMWCARPSSSATA